MFATTRPNNAEVNKKSIICSSVKSCVFSNLKSAPGMVPEEPAVGVAQIIPIAALTSFVAMAPLTASIISYPDKA
ncbi:Uncharacterised protein [Staphylococcus aureus]|nr:Uncharacterised protein [Staphylococcus aureus]